MIENNQHPSWNTAIMISEKNTAHIQADINPGGSTGPVAGCEYPDKMVFCQEMEKPEHSIRLRELFIPKTFCACLLKTVIDVMRHSMKKSHSFSVSISEQIGLITEKERRIKNKQGWCCGHKLSGRAVQIEY